MGVGQTIRWFAFNLPQFPAFSVVVSVAPARLVCLIASVANAYCTAIQTTPSIPKHKCTGKKIVDQELLSL